jgi:radical SAM superfamily enzyme YgiQ (UPF0313 family)
MKKNLSLDEVREKVSLLNECGFRPIGYFILGFPGETKDDLNKTLQLALELDLCAAAFTPFAPMPGTEATEKLVNSGELAADFDFTSVKSDVVTYAPQGMKRQELDEFRKFALLKFNLRPKQFLYYLSSYNGFKFALVKFFNLFIKGRQVSE